MGEIKLKLSEATERAFREKAMKTFGYSKGSLSAASEEAVREWIQVKKKYYCVCSLY